MTPLAELVERLASGGERVAGLAGSSKAYLISRLLEKGTKRVVVYLAPGIKEAARFQEDLLFFGHRSALFPPHDSLPFSGLSPHLDLSSQRTSVLGRLIEEPRPAGKIRVVVTTPTALLPYLPPRTLFTGPLKLKRGEEADREALIRKLHVIGYEKVTLVTDRATFAVRGSLMDLFPASSEEPIRIEWLGDLIESIRPFDPRTQKSGGHLEEVILYPAREIILEEIQTRSFAEKIRQRAEERDVSKSIWGPLVEKVKSGFYFSGIETYLPLFYDPAETFLDYLQDPLFFLDQPSLLRAATDEYYEEVKTLTVGRDKLIPMTEAILSPSALFSSLDRFPQVELLPYGDPSAVTVPIETHGQLKGEIDRKGSEPLLPIAKKITGWLANGRVILVGSSETQVGRLQDLFARYFHPPFPLELQVGHLSSGFRLPEEGITYLTDEEIFGPRVRTRKAEGACPAGARPAGIATDFSALSEIKAGDPLVHKQHGIGIYRGLIHMAIEGVANDFLLLEYRGGDKLYLPVYRMNLVQKYNGANGPPPTDRLGGSSWQNLRARAEKAIREMAGDLLNLYAARTAGKGFKFSPPNEMFEAFEASFPFEETPDQEEAIAKTLADMQKETQRGEPQRGEPPMDRLVLGDVGYGKTEVAMRAAFKAALDGKQTAVLVPTTLLAFQHGERFRERFCEMPVRIAVLSRFQSRTEQKRIIGEAREGTIDILIGTHRLLQADVSFKNLGLLVIDEEHRFGVSHKERLKHLKKNVDVLTLSATPIPRTLYMSLTGLRGVSVIETPPTDRLAVRTFVMPFEEAVIREAILKEIRRGGQVFFVHNRVETIGSVKNLLDRLVPEAKSSVAHGQMKEEELEEIMIRFYHQEFNLLIATTIIESGIDIPTANTILINEADHFGLAQIYQLRGRVGRGSHRAFCYLLVPPEKELTPEAVQRLQVLQRFSELGSGFRMANYDLEIRGAGNILGKEQSGQMTAIGYELYTELLEKAIRELKGEEVLDEIDPELHFRIPAYLPESYLPDPPLRLELYRRLSALETEDELDPILDEMRDRFGKPPEEVENLIALTAVKTYARKLRIKQIRYDGKSFVYAFDPTSPLPPEILTERIKKDPKHCRLTPDMRFIVQKPIPENLVMMETRRFLREICLHLN